MKNIESNSVAWASLTKQKLYGLPYFGPVKVIRQVGKNYYMVKVPELLNVSERFVLALISDIDSM